MCTGHSPRTSPQPRRRLQGVVVGHRVREDLAALVVQPILVPRAGVRRKACATGSNVRITRAAELLDYKILWQSCVFTFLAVANDVIMKRHCCGFERVRSRARRAQVELQQHGVLRQGRGDGVDLEVPHRAGAEGHALELPGQEGREDLLAKSVRSVFNALCGEKQKSEGRQR